MNQKKKKNEEQLQKLKEKYQAAKQKQYTDLLDKLSEKEKEAMILQLQSKPFFQYEADKSFAENYSRITARTGINQYLEKQNPKLFTPLNERYLPQIEKLEDNDRQRLFR